MFGAQGRPIQDFTDDLPVNHPRLAALKAMWDSHGSVSRLPSRDLFTAHVLRPWLANISLIDVVGDERPRFQVRTMGASCVHFCKGDFSGAWIDEAARPFEREKVLAPYRECLRTGDAIFSKAIFVQQGSYRALIHRVYLPCAETATLPGMIIVGLYGLQQLGRFLGAILDAVEIELPDESTVVQL